ncbi:MAG: YebC/PmpR family DNA-binding transcriptional regulator [Candidatus Omnitrophica bacterium]|nr:YebC/PmpR family DNA-binding transcriptional regulator [Candidatus Omnitrophota bacterium]
MSGHSKWASIKYKKAAIDSQRGKLFSKLVKELTVAARDGGGNPDTNPHLRLVIQAAKDASMPSDNIERAIKKGTGELPGVSYESVQYEGYGPGGVAIFLECLTDNKNRTASEIRSIFSKRGGNMAGAGSVAWLFEKKGLFVINAKSIEEDKLMEIVLSAGAEDLTREGETHEVTCLPQDFEKVRVALKENKVVCESAEITMLPKTLMQAPPETVKQALSLMEALEDHDDVQNVYTNVDVPEELVKELGGE